MKAIHVIPEQEAPKIPDIYGVRRQPPERMTAREVAETMSVFEASFQAGQQAAADRIGDAMRRLIGMGT